MPGALKPGLKCPVCGRVVLLVFHEWRGSSDSATFEYHHADDPERARRGGKPRLCTVVMPYDAGLKRYAEESAADLSTTLH